MKKLHLHALFFLLHGCLSQQLISSDNNNQSAETITVSRENSFNSRLKKLLEYNQATLNLFSQIEDRKAIAYQKCFYFSDDQIKLQRNLKLCDTLLSKRKEFIEMYKNRNEKTELAIILHAEIIDLMEYINSMNNYYQNNDFKNKVEFQLSINHDNCLNVKENRLNW